MPASPLTIVAITTALPGQEHALRAIHERLVADTRGEPGCLRYELNQSIENPRILVFTEMWASEAAWMAHMQGPAIERFRAADTDDLIDDFAIYRMALVTP
jgi:quinol monooxygenase YgiN